MTRNDLWSVSELAGEFDLTPQALRFYEEKGLLTPRRVGNTRVYDHRDRARLLLVRKFQRLGFSLEDIREYLSLYRTGQPNAAQYRDGLTKIRCRLSQLAAMKRDLEDTVEELHALEQDALQRIAKLEAADPPPGPKAKSRAPS
ncbi:MAG TPA: MerR family DNA-binding transcriptional regulator [Acetobacteraceae bacterium]|jgi:DNA-binding transcriptional MerR regulator|nr:MerR family DNA-binding transcriptional regulator [Acetobacteraceae bacterium]HUB47641.1 MerR family DNA-binding transcriptional regulator [Acetobacteraceae bacterium]